MTKRIKPVTAARNDKPGGETEQGKHDDTTNDLIIRLIDAAMGIEPGRRDIDAGLQKADRALRRHLGLNAPR